MIAIYCPEERQVRRLCSALSGISVQRSETWTVFVETVAVSACALVMADWLAGNPAVQRLEALRVQYPNKPLVLVTRKDADNARLLHRVEIDALVWTEEIEEVLGSAIDRACQTSIFQDIARRIENATHLSGKLRSGLTYLFRSTDPIRTVEDLAVEMGCDRRTLWRLWANTTRAHESLRLQDVIDWNLLLHACLRRRQTSSWVGIAAEFCIHEHTLARSAKRLTGMSLRDVAAVGPKQILEIFHNRMLLPLVNDVHRQAALRPGKRTDAGGTAGISTI